MFRTQIIAAAALFALGCGMGVDGQDLTATAQQDPLLLSGQLEQNLEPLSLQRGEWCWQESIRPEVVGTVHDLPAQRVREVMDFGPWIQSSYLNTNGDNEEVRRGIAEFTVKGDVRRAVLRFNESRTVWPWAVPADTHDISVYAGDLKATVEDFDAAATVVRRFETDVNAPPAGVVNADVTRGVLTQQPIVGFRFQLENVPGSGTQFDDVQLVITRCRGAVREL